MCFDHKYPHKVVCDSIFIFVLVSENILMLLLLRYVVLIWIIEWQRERNLLITDSLYVFTCSRLSKTKARSQELHLHLQGRWIWCTHLGPYPLLPMHIRVGAQLEPEQQTQTSILIGCRHHRWQVHPLISQCQLLPWVSTSRNSDAIMNILSDTW